jgi:hypothetical protein
MDCKLQIIKHRIYWLRHLAITLILTLILSACAIADEPTLEGDAPPRIAITPLVLELNYSGTCENEPAFLEVWIGSSLASYNTIEIMWQNLPTHDATDLLNDIERLVIMRNGLASLPAPRLYSPSPCHIGRLG